MMDYDVEDCDLCVHRNWSNVCGAMHTKYKERTYINEKGERVTEECSGNKLNCPDYKTNEISFE